jgi:RNA polymerase sigma-70 factor (ECF subfamily)
VPPGPVRLVTSPPVGADADPIALVAACRRGERAALDAVLRPLLPAIERLLARLVPAAEVEDLIQATIAAAIVAFPKFRGDATVKTWLLRIATYQVRDHWRSPGRRRRVALELVGDDRDELAVPGSPDAQVDARRRLARIQHHLAAIAPKKRMAFVLHVIDGRSIEEVAEVMDASVAATKSRVWWGRRALMARVRKDPLLADLAGEDVP